MEMFERRSEIRLALPECFVSGSRGSGRILDVSSAGMGVEVTTKCVFARGELHRLILSDPSQSVEVEGQVCWTQSNWRSSHRSQESEYIQTAGLAFSRLLTDHPTGIWSSLLAGMTRPLAVADPAEIPPIKIARQAPPLKMIEPIHDSTVSQQSVNVIFTICKPESITRIRINGVDALVMEDLGTAEVKLDKGVNRIVSMVRRRDGTYSTYLLGQVVRSRTH